jgi:pilus assembly protein TadC
MKWWEEYEEHAKHLCWEEEEIPLDDFEDVLDLIHECRESGGPMDAALRIEREHGVNPAIFGERFETVK